MSAALCMKLITENPFLYQSDMCWDCNAMQCESVTSNKANVRISTSHNLHETPFSDNLEYSAYYCDKCYEFRSDIESKPNKVERWDDITQSWVLFEE